MSSPPAITPPVPAPAPAVQMPNSVKAASLVIYFAAWVLLMWPTLVPLGRPATAMVGGALIIFLRQMSTAFSPDGSQGFDAFATIDWDPIALLFGLMLINVYLKRTGFNPFLLRVLDHGDARIRLLKIVAFSSVVAPFLMNDTVCLAVTPIVIEICRRRRCECGPMLMALVTSANIASAMTVTGNPQNALIADNDPRLTFLQFLRVQGAPTIAAQLLNTILLLIYYSKDLRTPCKNVDDDAPGAPLVDAVCVSVDDTGTSGGARELGSGRLQQKFVIVVMLLFIVMCALFVYGWDVDGVAVVVGMLLVLVHGLFRRFRQKSQSSRAAESEVEEAETAHDHTQSHTETDIMLEGVDFGLLLLFLGQFVLVGALVDTNLPKQFLNGMLGHSCEGARMMDGACAWGTAALVLFLSNLISNVPVVLMLKPVLDEIHNNAVNDRAWLTIAFVATLAGNLCMLGSAANLIVAHEAHKQGKASSFTTTYHAKFGVPSTILTIVVGLPIISFMTP